MKRQFSIFALVIFTFSCLVSTAVISEENLSDQSLKSTNKTYTTETQSKHKLSRKCAIYSGVCPMNKRAEVGAYCICNTPSGPIHGVVIP
ncbi:MAG: hypothetical protein ABW170_00925 [Candidatus Thiodiazotropha sp. L084R]